MSYKIRGWNSFYDGWLACCLKQSTDETKNDDWRRGWKIANETGEVGRMLGLCEEIKLSQSGEAKPCPHIIVESM